MRGDVAVEGAVACKSDISGKSAGAGAGDIPGAADAAVRAEIAVAGDVADPAASGPDLVRVRDAIERIDLELTRLMAERVQLARQAGEAKRAVGTFTLDPEREAAVVRHAAERGRAAGLDEEAVRAVFWQLIGMSRRAQQQAQDSEV